MTWARFDDQFYAHPKLAALGDYMLPCVGLNVLAVCYASSYLTDGLIPRAQVPRLAGDLGRLLQDGGSVWTLVERLVAANLWEERDGDFVVHDYLDYNPSRADVLKERAARHQGRVAGGKARAGSANRQRGRYVAEQHQQDTSKPTSKSASRTPAASQQDGQQETSSPPAPAPAPAPIPKKQESTTLSAPEAPVVTAALNEKEPTWPSPEALVEFYHQHVPAGHPRVQKLTAGRRQKALTYLKQFPERDFWVSVFSEISGSALLMGLAPSNGHKGFIADFDWLLTKGKDGTENCQKVAEGKYRDDLPPGNQGPAVKLLSEFGRLYEGKIGHPYVGTGPRDLGILESLLAVRGANGSPGFSPETMQRMMVGFFRFPPQWVRDKDRFDVPTFKTVFPELTRMLSRNDI